MRAPRGSVPDIREVTAVGVGICGRSVVRVWAKWGGGEKEAAAAWREKGRKGRERKVYDYAARFDDIPVKGINFTGNRSINACFMLPSDSFTLPTWLRRERNRGAFIGDTGVPFIV